MLEDLLLYDNQIVIFLNSLGSKTYDVFWVFVTNPKGWTWFFILIIFFIFKSYEVKKAIKLIVLGVITCVVTLVIVELIKRNVARLRPVDNTEIRHLLRIVTKASNYSFVSGHSAFSMALANYVFKLLKSKTKYSHLLFIFPMFFAYSRLYLGVHFLSDIISGLFLGYLISNLSWMIAKKHIVLPNSSYSKSISNRK